MCLSLDSPIGGNPIVYNRVKDGWGNYFMVANRIVAFWLLLVAFLDDFGNRWSRQFDLTDSDLRRDLENSKVLGYCSPTWEIGWEIPKLGQGRSQKEKMVKREREGESEWRKESRLVSISPRLITSPRLVGLSRKKMGEG